MSFKGRILHLVLKYYWFNEIDSGRKTEEYRRYPYWRSILEDIPSVVVFHRGYTSNIIAFNVRSVGREKDIITIYLGERILDLDSLWKTRIVEQKGETLDAFFDKVVDTIEEIHEEKKNE